MNPTTNNQRVINNPINPDNVPNNPDNRENAQIASVLGKWVRDESNAGSEPKKLKATASLSSSAQNEKSNSAENRAHLASQSILGKRKSSEDSSETHSLKLPYSPYNSRTQTRTFLNDVLQDFMSEIGDETEIKSIDEVDLEFLSKRRDLAEASGEVAIKYFKLLTKWNYTQFALNRFIDAIEDSSKLGLDEVNSDFLNQRRELAIKKGTVVVNDFNYVAKYLNKKDPEHPVKYIGNRSVINAKNSLNKAISLTPELQKLVLSALGTEEFKPKSVDEAIQIADQIHSHHLDLSDFREITDEQFKGIAKIHYLESINLSRLEFNQSGLAHLKSLQNLQALNLGHCRITDAGLAHLKDLPNLQALDLSFCYRITDAGLAQIKDLPNLQTLNLDHCRITDAGLAHLKYLPNLQTLYLNYCRQITDAGLAHLKDLPNLQTLDLNDCHQITDAGLAHLKDLPNLQTLNLSFCRRITDAGLAQIKDLPNLQTLSLSECPQITDAGLAQIKDLPNLQTLDLTYCHQITDAGLAHLKDLPNLQTLNLFNCNRITDAGLADLKMNLNQLKILR